MAGSYLRDEPTGLEGTARNIARAVAMNSDVLVGLNGLRNLGASATDAVHAVLDVRDLANLRLGWELYDCLASGSELDGDLLLLDYLPLEQIVLARDAFWGSTVTTD